jgi:low density lipoprotein-related protein 2
LTVYFSTEVNYGTDFITIILKDFIIPGVNDCGDRSDEIDCGNGGGDIPSTLLLRPETALTNTVCPAGAFACSNGHCINQSRLCDGHNDCHDPEVSDENAKSCPGLPIDCRGVRIKCPNTNICIQPADLCDGYDDCGWSFREKVAF